MELLSGNALARYLFEKYSKKPKGWNFTIAPSPKDNFFDALVAGPEESWQLKIDSIFKPAPLVLGSRVELDGARPATVGAFPYGYRKLEPEFVLKLLRDMSSPNSSSDSKESSQSLADLGASLGSLDPVAPVEGGSYAEGPFVFTNERIAGVSKSQKQLDEKLSSEIKKLLREKYPSYG